MDYLLLYVKFEEREVLVLEVGTENEDSDAAKEALENYGSDLANWPEDLGAYSKSQTWPGLMIWEGEVPDPDSEDEWKGKLRRLTEEEWTRVKGNLSPF